MSARRLWQKVCRGNSTVPARDVLLAVLPLLLPTLSPRVRMEMPLKLLALVTGGRRLRLEPSESVLLHGRGSSAFISLSVLLWRLPEARFKLSGLPLQRPDALDCTSRAKGQQQDLQVPHQYYRTGVGSPASSWLCDTARWHFVQGSDSKQTPWVTAFLAMHCEDPDPADLPWHVLRAGSRPFSLARSHHARDASRVRA